MAVSLSDLLLFNNVESTDVMHGTTELPYFQPVAYVPGFTITNGHERYVDAGDGAASQILVRRLGQITATAVKANNAGAFDFNHVETADTLDVVLIDDVIKHSEKLYEGVEAARQSKTGAKKAEIVNHAIIAGSQALISGYLSGGANDSTNADGIEKSNIKDLIAEDILKLDIEPTTIVVKKYVYGELLKLVITGDFIQNPVETAFRTGIVGRVLGLNVVVDNNLTDYDYIIYNHNIFGVFTILRSLDAVEAHAFKGSYIRGLAVQGGYAPKRNFGDGAWAIGHKTIKYTLSFDLDSGLFADNKVWPISLPTNTTKTLEVARGLLAKAPEAVPTRSGKVFDGYFANAAKTIPFDFAQDRLLADTTVYLKWKDA